MSMNDTALISQGVKSVTFFFFFFYLLVFSCISSLEQRNISNTQSCRDEPSGFQVCVGPGGAGVAGSLLFPCNRASQFFSEEVLFLRAEFIHPCRQ